MPGWLVAFLSMIVVILSLLPGFNSQSLSKKALELAEWTALKDYIEQCKEHLVSFSFILYLEAITLT